MSNVLDDLSGIPGASKISNIPKTTVNVEENIKTSPSSMLMALYCTDGYFKGKTFIFPFSKSVYMGRSTNNNIVFPEESRGVSRRHLEVKAYASEETLCIKDLSTYGTYSVNKKRYDKDWFVKLKKGDTIFFGDDQSFEVTCVDNSVSGDSYIVVK